MKLKSFDQFVSEELVYGFKSKLFDRGTANCFKDIFQNDPLKLKEFIQTSLPGQNLKYGGAGCVGLAFLWINPKPLPKEFYEEGFYGTKELPKENLVLKFTTNLGEVEGSKKLIDLSAGGPEPGFARYYWIKEIDLPESNWWSRTLGPQLPWQQMKKARGNDPENQGEYTFTTKEGDKETKPIKTREGDFLGWNKKKDYKRFIDIKKKAGTLKMTKAYIVCLEQLKLLTETEENLVTMTRNFLTGFGNQTGPTVENQYLIPGEDNTEKLGKIYDFMKSDSPEFVAEVGKNKWVITKKQLWGDRADTMVLDDSITKDFFIEFSNKVIDLYEKGGKRGVPTNDLHGGNMGYRGEELVGFDCM